VDELIRSGMASIGLVAVMLVGGFIYSTIWYRRYRSRRADFAQQAIRHGLRGFPEDPFGLDRLGMPLFEQGDQVTFTNVLLGEWKGLPFKAAELTVYAKSLNSKGRTELVKQEEYSVLVAELDLRVWMPWVVLTPESVLTKAKAALGVHDIQFESGQFNARFYVRAEDRRFAYQLIDARMMEYLLSTDSATKAALRYEVRGSRLLIATPRGSDNVILDDVFPLFEVASGMAERIPRVVWSEYAAGMSPAHRMVRR
jgi:uncharacterized protein DUF3137